MDFMRSHLCISTLDLKMTDKQCRTCCVEQPASLRCSEELFICFSDWKHGVRTETHLVAIQGQFTCLLADLDPPPGPSLLLILVVPTQVHAMRLVIPQSMFLHFQRIYWSGQYTLLVSMTGGVGDRSLSWDLHLPDGSVSWFTQWPVT